MFKKLLAAALVAGVAAYMFRDKLAAGFTKLEAWALDWAAEDPTEDDEPITTPAWDGGNRIFRGTAPMPDGFPVGMRHEEE